MEQLLLALISILLAIYGSSKGVGYVRGRKRRSNPNHDWTDEHQRTRTMIAEGNREMRQILGDIKTILAEIKGMLQR